MSAHRAGLFVLLAAAGCDGVFQLDRPYTPPPPDGAVPDAPIPPDAAICGGNPMTRTQIAEADAEIESSNDVSYGMAPRIRLGLHGGTDRRGLWRFPLTGLPVDRTKLVAMRVTLPVLTNDDVCGPMCGSCETFETAGDLEIYALKQIWDEADVSWINRDRSASLPWNFPGAGASSRGPLLASARHEPSQSLSFDLVGGPLAQALAEEQLGAVSFVVQANTTVPTARMLVQSGPTSQACAPSSVARIVVTYCP